LSTLWVYGDSYTVDYKDVSWQYYKELATIRNLELRAHGEHGVANEYICMKFIEDWKRENIKQGDTVIVVMTSCVRHWFLWDHPNVSNYQNMTNMPSDNFGITEEQISAMNLYYKHIQKGYVDAWKYDATTAWWNNYKDILEQKGVNLIVIPGFNNTTDIMHNGTIPVRGSLFETVCRGEFKTQAAMDKYYERGIPDQRINHMLRDNHHILAEALNSCLTNRTELDLNTLPWIYNKLSLSTEPMLKHQLSPTLLR